VESTGRPTKSAAWADQFATRGDLSLIDEGASLSEGATYKLVEVESRGRQRTYGPFAVVQT